MLMAYADSESLDQPAHSRRLIKTFVVRLEESLDTGIVSTRNKCSLEWIAAHDDLILRFVHKLDSICSFVAVYIGRISLNIHEAWLSRFDREYNTWSDFCWSYIFNFFQCKKRPFQSKSQNKIMFVSDLHLRSEQCYGIILFIYPL